MPILPAVAAALPAAAAASGPGVLGTVGGVLAKVAGGLFGGSTGRTRINVSQSQSATTTAAVSPNIFVQVGSGEIAGPIGASTPIEAASAATSSARSSDDAAPRADLGVPVYTPSASDLISAMGHGQAGAGIPSLDTAGGGGLGMWLLIGGVGVAAYFLLKEG